MRVQIVDAPAYTPPYDYALAGALARAGADVELVTSRFVYGPVPSADGFRVSRPFYKRTTSRPGLPPWPRRALRAAEHLPGMVALARGARAAELVHYQWLTLEPLDTLLLPTVRPRVLTLHNVLRRGRAGTAGARLLVRRMDALVVHTRHGALEAARRLGADPERVHHIPHGAFDYLTRQPDERPLPPELRDVEAPVILWFGVLRPYKGVELLLEAFLELEGAELWIVGRPWMSTDRLRELARRARGTVRFVDRFVSDAELPAYFRRADIVVLPHRRVDTSGVLYTALAFGKPLVLSDVGGFPELANEHGVARLVPPEDPGALRAALRELIDDPAQRERLAAAAGAAAAGSYSWDNVARRTLELYERLLRQ